MTPLNDLTPFGMFLLGEEPTIEDFILLIGTIVAFIAFVLWCCFPIHPKENLGHQPFSLHAAAKSSAQQTSVEDRNGRHDNTFSKYGQRSGDSSNTLYHCCNSNN